MKQSPALRKRRQPMGLILLAIFISIVVVLGLASLGSEVFGGAFIGVGIVLAVIIAFQMGRHGVYSSLEYYSHIPPGDNPSDYYNHVNGEDEVEQEKPDSGDRRWPTSAEERAPGGA